MQETRVSKEMLLDGAQMNIAGTVAAIAGFLKERSIPIKDFTTYMGEMFEGSFGDMQGRGADEVMEHLLKLMVLPIGVEVISSDLTSDRAEVTLTSSPPRAVLEKFGTTPRELLSGFGISQKEYESIYESYKPAMKAVGLKFSHHLKDGQQILLLERK